MPDLEDYFLTKKISLIQKHLVGPGFHVLLQIVESAAEEAGAIRRFASMQCSGWMTVASRLEDGGKTDLSGMPVVHVDPLHPRTGVVVKTDRRLAMRLAVRHLHSRGCRRLAVAGIDSGGAGYAGERE